MCSLLLLFKKGKECQAHFRSTVNTSKNCFNPSARLELPQNRMSETKLNEQFSSTKLVLPYILSLLSLSLPPSSSILINLLLLNIKLKMSFVCRRFFSVNVVSINVSPSIKCNESR